VYSLGRPALKFAFMLVQDIDVAEEIVQDGFARAWASPSTPVDPAEFRRWLYRIITNLANDYFRGQKRIVGIAALAPSELDPVATVEARSVDESLEAALRSLSLGERQAIYLRYFEDQSFKETARILGRPQVSVRVVVHRALGKLRIKLEAAGHDRRMAI
jgi:RNA polymerase sigma-70 factor (ECF subfamily)